MPDEREREKGDLTTPVNNTPLAEVIGRDLDRDRVPGDDADEVFAHAASNVRNDLVAVAELDAKLGIRQSFLDFAFNLDGLFFSHGKFPSK
jgi:hypothetical protein